MKHLKRNTILLFLVTILVLVLVLKDDFNNIVDVLLTMNYLWLLLVLVCLSLFIIFRSIALYVTVKDEIKGYRMKDAIKHNIITQFFNGITPFSSGGQPMEIYMIHKRGVRIAKATNLIMQTFIFYQIALVLYGMLAIGGNYFFHFFQNAPLLRTLILIGFLINTLVAVFLLVVSFSKKVNTFVVEKGVLFLSRFHIIKDKEQALKNWRSRLEEFHATANQLRKKKGLFIGGICYNLLSLTFYYIIPLFLAFSMHQFDKLTPVTAIVSSAYVLLMGSFVPIPGASGGIEYGFLVFFGNFLGGATLSALLLLWRTVTYYLPMIAGAFVLNFQKEERKE